MKTIKIAMLLMVLFLSIPTAIAHGDDNHKKKDDHSGQTVPHGESVPVAAFDDFPNLHPLMVHFPIVLLLLAAVLALANVVFLKKEIDWVITLTVAVGALGAYAAGRWYHPHAHDLTERAQAVLEQHDFYADWTIWLSITGLIVQLISQFVGRQKRWAAAIVSIVLIGAAFTVSKAGHYGSQLVHIEGVGPQGHHLESGEHEHSH